MGEKRTLKSAMAGVAAARYAAAMPIPLSLKTRLSTPLFEQTRSWYCDLLRLDVLEEWDEPTGRGCILGFADSDAFLEIYYCEEPHNFAGLSLQFRVDDVDALVVPDEERFTPRGPEERPWGSKYLYGWKTDASRSTDRICPVNRRPSQFQRLRLKVLRRLHSALSRFA